VKLMALVGSGDKVMLFTLPFLVVGLILNVMFPAFFDVGGPSDTVRAVAIAMLVVGVPVWIWSVVLILTKASKGELITGGPFALVKHPLYTSVALLVVPAIGFLLNSWLGVVVGLAMYVGSRRFSGEEEEALSKAFGATWEEYCGKVMLPWL